MKVTITTPILFLDLDGTVRLGFDELGHFVNGAEDVKIFGGVPELMKKYKYLGWRIVGVSNQGGIEQGHLSDVDCAKMMSRTDQLCDWWFDNILWCPHYSTSCFCRKPRPGMLFYGALDLTRNNPEEHYVPDECLMVGDRPEDHRAADNAGVGFCDAKNWREGEHLDDLQARSTLS